MDGEEERRENGDGAEQPDRIAFSVKLLLIEDNRKFAATLARGLEEEGYSVETADDGLAGLEMADACRPDVIVLDIMLPKLDGLAVARRLRQAGNTAPILMLTARDAASDVVAGLDTGADDYLTKPFAFDILLARLRALLRRGASPRAPELRVLGLVLDPAAHDVRRDGRRLTLTRTEYRLLETLMRCKGAVVSRNALIEAVWGMGGDIENNTLDAFVRLLRSKIDAGFSPRLLHTARGVGYYLRETE
jgi:two-component system, OmpR family, response regulator MprA